MKLAIISGIDKETTKESKGGVETWTSNFILEEAKRGINIDLYAVGGSINTDKVHLKKILEKSLPYFYESPFFKEKRQEFTKRKEQFMSTVFGKAMMEIKKNEKEYDLIVDSCSYPSFSFNANYFTKPVLSIGHFPPDFALQFYVDTFGLPDNVYYSFPSLYSYKNSTYIPSTKKRIIHHGIDIKDFEFNREGGKDMLWMSRIHERINKGVVEAIKVSQATNKKLKILGFLEKSSEDYFERTIKPILTDNILFKKVDNNEIINKNLIFGQSKLFLFPIQWEEPFGLVMVESMACGTPVVAFARGSVPDIIKDGETGFIINPSEEDKRENWIIKKTGIEGLNEAVERIYSMSELEYKEMRRKSRENIEKNFKLEQMVDKYEEFYKEFMLNH